MQNAWLFVDFFFVLSGFVIAYAYLDSLGTPRATRIFVIRRIGRVWPLHVVLLGVFVAFEAPVRSWVWSDRHPGRSSPRTRLL